MTEPSAYASSSPSSPAAAASVGGATPGAPSRSRPGPLIGEIIVDLGFATPEVVEAAVATARTTNSLMGQVLLQQGVLTSEQLARAIALRFGLEYVDLNSHQIDMTATNLVNPAAAKRLEAIPIGFVGSATLLVAMADPANVMAIDDIAMLTGFNVRPAVAAAEDIASLIARVNRFEDAVQDAVDEQEPVAAEGLELQDSADDAPVIKLVRSIIAQAVDQGASDIHFEPENGDMQVRFRVDGVMIDATTVPRRMVLGVVSRLKIMADLDISERRVPQDGRMGLTVEDRQIDVRVVSLPLVNAESVVLRILDQGSIPMGLDELGMRGEERRRFEQALGRSYGGILTTGPTGAGKSTTLYAALMKIRSREKTIVTIEDPVEYQLEGIKQIQVNDKVGLGFANGLRSMMRADPDIIMVGEIRDSESALITVESALTGHLVLSTLHTNDAPTAITRLIEMGIEPFLVASAVDCVVAQRLARRLCEACKKPMSVPAVALSPDGVGDVQVFDAQGCRRCNNTGYRGRIGLYEVMTVDEEIRTLIIERRAASEIAAAAIRGGMRRLRDEGMEKVRAGEISMAELARVTGS